ncbi:MAG: HAMP domain-containing histidine kinase [Acidimicrobiia bacterium]|nr:HAMP domain-containing histidine kinase [Acidimicrobiia bacterium]MYC46265.1 HAMP domain-containing histidine kinase [Acidimicrobiia bacterium]
MSLRGRYGLIRGWRVVPASQVSLRARVGLLAFAGVILGVGLAVGGGYYFAQRELHQEVDQFLARRAHAVSEVLENPSGLAQQRQRGARPVIGRIPLADFDAQVQILNAAGRPVFAVSDVPLPVGADDRLLAVEGGEPLRRTVTLDGQRYRMLTSALDGNGAVQVARDLGETDRALNDLLRRTIPLGVILATVAAAMAWLLARRALRPIEQLTSATERVAQTKELAGTIEATRDDEVGRLARSFNSMLEALQTSRRQQQRLVADAGHELRTPLTSMRTNIEHLQRVESLGEEARRRILVDVNAELRELGDLVAELVELASETGAADEPLATIELADLAEGAAARARRRTNRDITTVAEFAGTVQGQRGSLERAVDNLVGNALKFSPEDTPIRLVTSGGRLEVHDCGPGIPTEDQPLIFERFFRSAGTRSEPGSGLGLAIVKQIVERHGGRVWAGASPEGGAAVGFEIPTGEADDH